MQLPFSIKMIFNIRYDIALKEKSLIKINMSILNSIRFLKGIAIKTILKKEI